MFRPTNSRLVQEMRHDALRRGPCPCDPGIYRFPARMAQRIRGDCAAPAIPAPKSTLWSHPCVAVPFARVFSASGNYGPRRNRIPSNGDHPLNSVSHHRGSLHEWSVRTACLRVCEKFRPVRACSVEQSRIWCTSAVKRRRGVVQRLKRRRGDCGVRELKARAASAPNVGKRFRPPRWLSVRSECGSTE